MNHKKELLRSLWVSNTQPTRVFCLRTPRLAERFIVYLLRFFGTGSTREAHVLDPALLRLTARIWCLGEGHPPVTHQHPLLIQEPLFIHKGQALNSSPKPQPPTARVADKVCVL